MKNAHMHALNAAKNFLPQSSVDTNRTQFKQQ